MRRRARAVSAALLALAALGLVVAVPGCALVPQNRRKHLGDPMMSLDGDPTLAASQRKLYTSREAAAGGDAAPAGGGCGCQ